MGSTTIDRLIINSPYQEPTQHWKYARETQQFECVQGRRPAGYTMASPDSKAFDDPGVFIEIPLVNQLRPRVKAWREGGYMGGSGMTKRLLSHWNDNQVSNTQPFFFCQLEAMETLIWLTEAPASQRVGIDIPSDGGAFQRQCCKMATGSGKTVVMAMLIAWHILNKVADPKHPRFSRHVLVIAPGLTVKSRLAVLEPTAKDNYYEAFDIVPSALLDKLRQAKVLVHNWHTLDWEREESIKKRRSVDKRGAKSDEAYARGVLGAMANTRNILVINDEAHHAWRVNLKDKAEGKYRGNRDLQDSTQAATIWVGALERLHRSRCILACYDFSATPFAPSGKRSEEESLFGWIVSDFGLNDAIESGLVKTPRVVVRDDALPDTTNYKSRLYHIYNDPEVKDDLNRKALPLEPLPDLVLNAYYLLGYDWRAAYKEWQQAGLDTPPVMITVCNRTETAARVKHAFDSNRIPINELCDSEHILHIDSKVLKQAEEHEQPLSSVAPGTSADTYTDTYTDAYTDADTGTETDTDASETPTQRKLTKAEQAEQLRRMVDTVGKPGQPGEAIQNVISVGMLSEGWDAKTVTHIMGLRAFSSQLLCEQVVGRGLRRTAYEVNPESGLFDPEYVNIFGVPFTFLPYESSEDGPPQPPKPKTEVRPDATKQQFAIHWPNVVRIENIPSSTLSLDWNTTPTLDLDAAKTVLIAEMAPVVDGKSDLNCIDHIELEKLAQEHRTQRIIFETARDVFDQMKPSWRGNRKVLLAQLVRIVEAFMESDRIRISPPLFYSDRLRRRLTITLNISHVVRHVLATVQQYNTESLTPVFDTDNPLRSTGNMHPWYTGKPCQRSRRSHINVCVYDSTWEASDAFLLDNSEYVEAWVKNDHLRFEVLYVYRGIVHKYRPDFLVKLVNGQMLILETKGRETDQDKAKRLALEEWAKAVNAHGGFGKWHTNVAKEPGEIRDILISSCACACPDVR